MNNTTTRMATDQEREEVQRDLDQLLAAWSTAPRPTWDGWVAEIDDVDCE